MVRATDRLLNEYRVVAAQAGDRAAWAQLARHWESRMIAHAYRLTGDREMARDAAQQAWGEIVKGLPGLQDARAFPAWAFRITSRACAKEIGKQVRDRDLKAAYASEPLETATPPDEPSEADVLQAAIRQLPAGERAAIALYHFEEMRVAEVAVALAIPAGTVKTRLMHARRKLRAILEPESSQGETP